MYSAVTIPLSFQYMKKLLGSATKEGIDTLILRAKGQIIVLKTKSGRGMQTSIIVNPPSSLVYELLGDGKVLIYEYTGYRERKKILPADRVKTTIKIIEDIDSAINLLLQEP